MEIMSTCPYCEVECDTNTCVKYLAYKKVNEPGVIEATLSEMGINPDGDKLEIMMKMQHVFAERFHPVSNLSKEEIEHWVEAYIDCVEDELREVREHIPWQNGVVVTTKETNIPELKKEIIDILHFIMDELIVADVDHVTLNSIFSKQYNVDLQVDDVLETMLDYEAKNYNTSNLWELSKDEAMMQAHNYLLDSMGNTKLYIDWKHWKKKKPTLDKDNLQKSLVRQWLDLLTMFNLMGMNSEEIFDTYVKKNCENVWRQKLGY